MRDSLGSMASSPPVASGFLAAIVEGDIDSLLASLIRKSSFSLCG